MGTKLFTGSKPPAHFLVKQLRFKGGKPHTENFGEGSCRFDSVSKAFTCILSVAGQIYPNQHNFLMPVPNAGGSLFPYRFTTS